MHKSRFLYKRRLKKKKRIIGTVLAVIVLIGLILGTAFAGICFADRLYDKNTSEFTENAEIEASAILQTTPKPENVKNLQDRIHTGEIVFEERVFYAVQVGAFANEKTALSAADEIKSVGGAGFVHFDSKYRVLACAYHNETDAENVRQILRSNGIDNYIYKVTLPSLTLSVSAPKEQLDDIENVNRLIFEAAQILSDMADEVDKKSMNALDAIDEAEKLSDELLSGINALKKCADVFEDDEGVIACLLEMCINLYDGMQKICLDKAPDAIALSASMRYNVIDTIIKYSKFIDSLCENAALI